MDFNETGHHWQYIWIFGGLAERYQAIGAAHTLPADVLRMTPKIARGEKLPAIALCDV